MAAYTIPEGAEAGERIEKAISMILDFGWIDGGHHKMWVLDQTLRILLADEYDSFMAQYNAEGGDNGEQLEPWDTGIAP